MPSYSNFYKNGWPKFLSPKATGTRPNKPVVVIPPSINSLDGLYGIDIKTNVQGQSIKVVKAGQIIAHFELSEISTWELSGIEVKIFSSDEQPVVLSFVNETEASLGDNRLLLASNGGLIA